MKDGCKIRANKAPLQELFLAYSQTRKKYTERNHRKMVLAFILFTASMLWVRSHNTLSEILWKMLKKTKPEERQKVNPSDDLKDLAKIGFDRIQMKFSSSQV